MEMKYDFLLCLSIETLNNPPDDLTHRFPYFKKEFDLSYQAFKKEEFPEIVEMDFCAYDVKSQLVTEEHNYFVKPDRMELVTPEFTKLTGIYIYIYIYISSTTYY